MSEIIYKIRTNRVIDIDSKKRTIDKRIRPIFRTSPTVYSIKLFPIQYRNRHRFPRCVNISRRRDTDWKFKVRKTIRAFYIKVNRRGKSPFSYMYMIMRHHQYRHEMIGE